MKNLLFRSLLFLLFLIVTQQTLKAQSLTHIVTNPCFSMTIEEVSSQDPKSKCFDITVTPNPLPSGQFVVVSNPDVHREACPDAINTFTWCYDRPANEPVKELIECFVHLSTYDYYCLDGCIIVIEP